MTAENRKALNENPKLIRPRFTRKQAECLYYLARSVLDKTDQIDLIDLLGTPERVQLAREALAKLRRACFGPEQPIDEPEEGNEVVP